MNSKKIINFFVLCLLVTGMTMLTSCNYEDDFFRKYGRHGKGGGKEKDDAKTQCNTLVSYEADPNIIWDTRQFNVLDGDYAGKKFVALNFADYQSQIALGKKYLLGYKIIKTDIPSDNAEYIEITCLSHAEESGTNSCNTLVYPHWTKELPEYHFDVLEGDHKGDRLRAINYDKYKSELTEGITYKIGYNIIPTCGMNEKYPDLKYVEITCLTPVDDEGEGGCGCKNMPILYDNNSTGNDFNLHGSNALKGAYIKDDKLYVTGQFISTDKKYAPDYQLIMEERPYSNLYPFYIVAKLDVKDIKTDGGLLLDLKTYTKEYCFDLTKLKKKYEMLMIPSVVLHIEMYLAGGNDKELIKYPIN